MSTDFRKAASIGGQCNCVAAQQKAVYNWHETRHSDEDVVDIYSPEWQQRITLWHTRFVEEYGTEHVHSETLELREAPQNLKLWSFFFEHPIAAFSLWHVCQAFYEFDKAVCGTSSEVESTLKGWQELKLFEYLQSPDVKRRWKNELKRLDTEISYGDLSGEKLKSRMYDILDAVERLETALASLEDDIKFDYDEKKSTEWMLDTITEAFDERCVLIAKLLKRDANEHTYDVILSDPGGQINATDQSDSARARHPPPGEHDGYLQSLLFLLDVLSIRAYGIGYVVLCIAVAILSLYIASSFQSLGTNSKIYE